MGGKGEDKAKWFINQFIQKPMMMNGPHTISKCTVRGGANGEFTIIRSGEISPPEKVGE